MILREGDLEFDFSGATEAYKFDDPRQHGLSVFKAVDFFVEYEDKIYFIEIKDPENKAIKASLKSHKKQEMKRNMTEDEFLHYLGQKCRDSYLYHILQDKVFNKPVFYIVLVAFETTSTRSLEILTKNIKISSGMLGPSKKGWAKPYLAGVIAVDLTQWQKIGLPILVRRIP